MNTNRSKQPDRIENDSATNRIESSSSVPNDVPDSKHDEKELQPEETFINLPNVKDIPGQEFINTLPAGELGDTTISSDDEEGTGVFDRDDSENLRAGNSADISREEKARLEDMDYMPTKDEDNLYRASLDATDIQGDPLKERSFGDERSGTGMDSSEHI